VPLAGCAPPSISTSPATGAAVGSAAVKSVIPSAVVVTAACRRLSMPLSDVLVTKNYRSFSGVDPEYTRSGYAWRCYEL
jgi:hypothetical protein